MSQSKTVRNFDKWLKDYLLGQKKIELSDATRLEIKAKEEKVPFHEIIIREGYLKLEEVYQLASSVLAYDTFFFDDSGVNEEQLRLLSRKTMEKYTVIALNVDKEDRTITVAISNPSNLMALDEIRRETKLNPKPVFAIHSQIIEAMESNKSDLSSLMEEMSNANVTIEEEKEEELTDMTIDKGDEPIVVRMVNSILSEAIQHRASDIHIEPMEHSVRVRMRLDGMLVNKINNLDRSMLAPLISKIKVLSSMDITETRRPQDGRFRIKTGNGQQVDFRVSTMLTQFGEKAVLRVTIRDGQQYGLNTIGFDEEEQKIIQKLASRPYGLILVTGPTGSGKSTTLYGMLGHLNQTSKNIVTIEDPIEREIHGVIQTPVNVKSEVTFSSGLKTILRQDPDIIMVGEIRDKETAETTIQAALTGHLVLSTLHTNDSAGSIPRLMDMGIDSYKIPSALLATIAQRLLRKNCDSCSIDYQPNTEELAMLRSLAPDLDIPDDLVLKKGKGCKKCNNTGYRGRQGVFEILIMDDDIKELTLNGASATVIKKTAIEKGMKTMEYRGAEKVLDGLTTIEELQRVIFIN